MKTFRIFGVVLLLSAVGCEETSVSQLLCPFRNLTVAVDDHLRLYFDGIEITDLPNANITNKGDVVELPCTTRLIAIHGRNGPGPGGILASTGDEYVLTNSTWKCSNVSHPGWEEIDFDDSAWASALEYGHSGDSIIDAVISGISPNAFWIWLRQPDGYSTFAEMDVDVYCRMRLDPSYCTSVPCAFGGTCIDDPDGQYHCICAPGYTGQNCSVVINYCESNPCTNGGSCLPIVNGYTCQCSTGYTGDKCEFVTNNCESSPCLNGGTCLNGFNYFVCVCPLEWTGTRCDALHNPCGDQLCANGGSCLNNCGEPQCICRPGWTGDLCVAFVNPCESNPCLNGGSCYDVPDGWMCTCPPSLTGSQCEQIVDLCANQQCLNGGTCVFDCGISQCFCRDGWTGENCESFINACNPNPCLNNGTCNNLIGGLFDCTCPTSWTGVRCESINYDESLACGSTLTWSQYDPSNDFTRLCYFWAPPGDTNGRYTECRYTITGIPLYGDYTGLLKAGGNFGCHVSQNYPEDLPITSQLSCEDNYQHDVSLGNYTESARLMVCLRYPYDGQPGRK